MKQGKVSRMARKKMLLFLNNEIIVPHNDYGGAMNRYVLLNN